MDTYHTEKTAGGVTNVSGLHLQLPTVQSLQGHEHGIQTGIIALFSDPLIHAGIVVNRNPAAT
jgi:hypothetical protein